MRLSRRTMLGVGAGLGVAAVAGCSTAEQAPTGQPTVEQVNSAADLPDYQPRTEVTPDLSSDDPRIPVAFLHYPADPVSVNGTEKPGSGGTVTAFAQVGGALPTPMGQNEFWQQLNDRLGVKFDMLLTPAGEFNQKLQTLVAGDTLPDMVQLRAIPDLPSLLEARFEPLGQHLAGDKIADYPNLAAIPSYAWSAAVYNGEVFGVPFSQPAVSNGMFARQDLLDAVGATNAPADGEEFLALCREVADPARGRYAMCAPTTVLQNFVLPMLGGANRWRVDDGQFVNAWETEEFERALEIVAQAWEEELFHPDSLGTPQNKEWLGQGSVVLNSDGLTAVSGYRKNNADVDGFDLSVMAPPLWDGGGVAGVFQGTGIFTFVGLRAAEPERIRELLRIIDWLACPFGSEEYMFKQYGIEGRNYELEGTDPIAGGEIDETRLPVSYVGRCAPFIYSAGFPDDAQLQFDYQEQVVPDSVPLPTVGLYSPSEFSIGPDIGRNLGDLMTDIIQGRKKLTEWAAGVAQWKSAGGDTIAAEFTQAYEEANG